MGTVEQAAMNAGLNRMLVRQPGLFFVVLVPAGPRTHILGATLGVSRHGSVEKIRRTK